MTQYFQTWRSLTLHDFVRALGALLGVILVVSVPSMQWLIYQSYQTFAPDSQFQMMYWLDAAQIFALGVFLLIPYRITRRHKMTQIIFCWLMGHYAATMTIQAFRQTDLTLELAATVQYLITALIVLTQAYLLLRPARPPATVSATASEAPASPQKQL